MLENSTENGNSGFIGLAREVGLQVLQVRRQEGFVEVARAQEHIELGALAHDPQHQEGPHAGLVGTAPGGGCHRHRQCDQRQLVVQHGLQGKAGAPPAGRPGGQFERRGPVT
jgi:hypothetical protein